MVALYFDHQFLKLFAERKDRGDEIINDFYHQFLKTISGVKVFVNIEFNALQELIENNELYSLLSDINSPICLNFYDRLNDSSFYKEGSITKLFFVEDCNEHQLQNESGYYFISNQTLKEKWKLFLSNHQDRELLIKSNPGPEETGVFRTWSDMSLFKHKTKNILLFDLYAMANKKNQRIENNLLPCILQLIKNTDGGPDELTIFTKELGQNLKNFWIESDVNQLTEYLKPLQNRIKNINFIKYDVTRNLQTDQEHNRCILTNYFYIRFPAGFNVFKENGDVNHRDEIQFDSILKNRTRQFVKELLNNLKQYTLQLKQKDFGVDNSGKVIEQYYYYPNLECRFFN